MENDAKRVLYEIHVLWKKLPALTQSRNRSKEYREIEAQIKTKSEEFMKLTGSSFGKRSKKKWD